MKQRLLGTAVAAVCATAMMSAQAQTPPQQAQREQAPQQEMVTVVGCLHPESKVPGRDQTVFQRWGITAEDFLLVQAEVKEGHKVAGMQPGQPVGTAGYTGAGAALMPAFQIEGLDSAKLKQYQGQRVQIQGRLEKADRPGAAPTGPPPTAPKQERQRVPDELPTLQATSIQKAEGTCPPTAGR